MKRQNLSGAGRLWAALGLCLAVLVGAEWLASQVQSDFGRVEVGNVSYNNEQGILVRAKLMRPLSATEASPGPGVVYIHGYQNNRETGDACCLELARRGLVVLNIDAIGRGNSGRPSDPAMPGFDATYGGRRSLEYLRSLGFVDPGRVGMMGHSLGAEMAYEAALADPGVEALVLTGFAYTDKADFQRPKNMLMIIGRWDEFRQRMTGVRDIEQEWMKTERTGRVIPDDSPELGVTYGDFRTGTARRVFVPKTIHFQESHNGPAIAEAVNWMRLALHPPEDMWIDPADQTWPVKEWATLAAMLAGLGLAMPLGSLLLRTPLFSGLRNERTWKYACPRECWVRHAAINGLLMWLYLPLIFVLFGLHIYVVKIDRAFPMMMVNGIVWWFFWINVFGFFLLRRWYRRQARAAGITPGELGVSFSRNRFGINRGKLARTALLAAVIFAIVYGLEHGLESLFIVDWRFIFPFASDLTGDRFLIMLTYLPFLLAGFLQTGAFLHGQIRLRALNGPVRTWLWWSAANVAALTLPLLLFLCVQYVPLLVSGFIPLVGPGGMFVSFILNLFHIILVLAIILPISTWMFQATGRIFLGAILSALLVAWMFASSQVIAPIPV